MITYFVICLLHKNSWVIVELYHIPYVGCKNINDYPGPGSQLKIKWSCGSRPHINIMRTANNNRTMLKNQKVVLHYNTVGPKVSRSHF